LLTNGGAAVHAAANLLPISDTANADQRPRWHAVRNHLTALRHPSRGVNISKQSDVNLCETAND
jgi:hypothetical protein